MGKINKDLSIWLKSGKTEDIKDLTLGRGELGYDTSKKSLKVGDGKAKFSQLPGLGGTNKIIDATSMFEFGYTGGYERTTTFDKPNSNYNLCGLILGGDYGSDYYSLAEILSVDGRVEMSNGNRIHGVKCYRDYVEMIWASTDGRIGIAIPVYEQNITSDWTEYNPDTDYGYSY